MSARYRRSPIRAESGQHRRLRQPNVIQPPFGGSLPCYGPTQLPAAHQIQALLADNQRLARARMELKDEIEDLKREVKRLRAAIAHEKKVSAESVEQGKAMVNKVLKMTGEMEKIRAKLATVEKGSHGAGNPDSSKQSLAQCTKAAAGSSRNCFVSKTCSKTQKEKIKDEIQHMDQTKMDTRPTQILTEGNVNRIRKRKRIKKKAINKDEIRSMDCVDGMLSLPLPDKNNGEGINGELPKKWWTAQESESSAIESSLSDLVHDKSIFPVDGMLSLPYSNKNNGEGIDGKLTEKEWTAQESEISARIESSLSDMVHDKVNPFVLCNNEEAEVSVRKESSLPDLMHDKDSPLDLGKDKEMEWTTQESEISAREQLSLPDLLHGKENPLGLCEDKEAEVSVGKDLSLPDLMHDEENSLDLSRGEEIVLLPGAVEVSRNRVSSEIVEERSDHVSRPMEVEGNSISCEIQHSPHPNQMVGVNAELENVLNEVKDEIVVDQGHCSADGSRNFSTCDVEMATRVSSPSPHVKEAECLLIEPISLVKRKLLVLDVNGLLTNIVMPAPTDCRADAHILERAIFKRPFCQDFLKFCFENFDVGAWSSVPKRISDGVVDYLLGDLKDKLLFCWDRAYQIIIGGSLTRASLTYLWGYITKPVVCKEMRKIWQNGDPAQPWKNGDYDESNTLLLGNSRYEALLNPLHTAIFPKAYHYEDKNDNSLGPGGNIRVYLEGLLISENVKKYVEEHPFIETTVSTHDRVRVNQSGS